MSDEVEVPQAIVAGKYRLTKLLGRGGMGSVWEGIHGDLGTRVAVKFIDKAHATSEEIRQRFINEAKAAARLRSKHVVQVYDQGVTADGRPYIVMEFLHGEPLDARLDRLGKLSVADTATILLQVARALAKAHEIGIVHRDLKPENVFLVWDDEDHMDVAKVVDFGIAKFTDATSAPASGSTRTGAVLGTPHYMSPEQARGLRTVDSRTDVWSLGVIGYRCIVGELPFEGQAVGDLLVNICTADVPVASQIVPDLPAGFDEWVRKALAKEPDARFQSARGLADELARLAGLDPRSAAAAALSSSGGGVASARQVPESAEGTSAPLTTTLNRNPKRRPLVLGIAAFAAAAVGFIGLRLFTSGPTDAATAEPSPAVSGPALPSVEVTSPNAPAEDEPKVAPTIAVADAPPPAASASEASTGATPPPTKASSVKVDAPRSVSRSQPSPKPAAQKPGQKRPTDVLGY
jgi:serine/threonine protein kinase